MQLSADRNVTATFITMPPLKIPGIQSGYYDTFTAALADIGSSGIFSLLCRAVYREKASRDSLTGLWNHEEILGILKHELSRADSKGKCVGVIMSDLDFFKDVNDRYGHITGDSVLRGTAEKIRSVVRSYDFVGRYGGEEFLVILPDCTTECATGFAERIRQFMSNNDMNMPEGTIPVTMSLGVAVTCTEKKSNVVSLVKAADAALYPAKEKGRNRVEIVRAME